MSNVIKIVRVSAAMLADLARRELRSCSDADSRRDELRAIGFPPLRLAQPDEHAESLPPGWSFGTREPCAAGHGDDVECEVCRGTCEDGSP